MVGQARLQLVRVLWAGALEQVELEQIQERADIGREAGAEREDRPI
jgi:hypothetical protein